MNSEKIYNFPHWDSRHGLPQFYVIKVNNMAEQVNAEPTENKNVRQFHDYSEQEIQNLLDGKDKQSTQKATDAAIGTLKQFLAAKHYPKLEDLDDNLLPDILFAFYASVRPKKNETYAVQTLKCLRSGLSRYFRSTKGWDIIKDAKYVRPNEMMKAKCVDSKKKGKGVRQSTAKISQIDMERITE